MGSLGQLVEPVAVSEAQKGLETGVNPAPETAYGLRCMDVQVMHRIHHAIGKHQQRCAMEMRDHEQQNVLVTELGQDAAPPIVKIIGIRISGHDEGTPSAKEAGVGASLRIGPEAVIAVARLELSYVWIVRGQRLIGMESGDHAEAQPAVLR